MSESGKALSADNLTKDQANTRLRQLQAFRYARDKQKAPKKSVSHKSTS